MAELSAEDIAQRAFGLELLDDRSFRDVRGEIAQKHLDSEAFRQLLLRRGLLTPYQMDRLMRGDRAGYFYGNYKVLYQVGAGTFARVYRAVHRETEKVFGVKVLRTRFTTDPKKCEQFRREAEVGLTLRHPNIVAIYEVGAEKAAQYIVMEFVEGQSLRDFIKRRKQIDPPEAIRLIADIARGLDYAAKRGVSHRDLKASNVLVTTGGQAKLVDFGLAGVDPEASEELSGGIENPRTIDYVALDRVTGVPNGDVRGDIFFAGCILYRMLSGAPPLDETRDRILRSNPSRFLDIVPIKKRCPELPPNVIAVVERAMELNPKHRYQTPGEMVNELTALQRRMGGPDGGGEAAVAAGEVPSKNRTVMIVESNAKLQDGAPRSVEKKRLPRAGHQRSAAAVGLVCGREKPGRMRVVQHRFVGRASSGRVQRVRLARRDGEAAGRAAVGIEASGLGRAGQAFAAPRAYHQPDQSARIDAIARQTDGRADRGGEELKKKTPLPLATPGRISIMQCAGPTSSVLVAGIRPRFPARIGAVKNLQQPL